MKRTVKAVSRCSGKRCYRVSRRGQFRLSIVVAVSGHTWSGRDSRPIGCLLVSGVTVGQEVDSIGCLSLQRLGVLQGLT